MPALPAPPTRLQCTQLHRSRPTFHTPRIQRRTARQTHTPSASASPDVVVVGGGVAGLTAALKLSQAGLQVQLHEASDSVGGRVRTDEVDGFLLDRGFQIFLTSYPEARDVLDYDALDLKPFYAGASVRYDQGWHRVADPFRHLSDGIASLGNPIGSPVDKVLVGVFRAKSLLGSLDDLLREPETTTMERLRQEGFSQEIIDRFFRPFLGGIFFNRDLTVTSRLFRFVMRMLATGSNCLPAAGIGAVATQLAAQLPEGCIVTNSPVARVRAENGPGGPCVELESGAVVTGPKGVVVAVDEPAAGPLLGGLLDAVPSKPLPGVGTCCLYFRAQQPPLPEPMLYLNGDGGGIINNMCFPSTVAPSYAPPGSTLVSVSTIGTYPDLNDTQLINAVQEDLITWWGPAAAQWQHLKTYRIPFAQPNQAPPTDLVRPVALQGGVFVCGDHRDSATLDGAIKSGRRAAEAVLTTAALAAPATVVSPA